MYIAKKENTSIVKKENEKGRNALGVVDIMIRRGIGEDHLERIKRKRVTAMNVDGFEHGEGE